jgi:hypothetical protein
MYNTNTPTAAELPSARALLRSTLIAAGVALLLLVTVVMPAEYGVDPTGIGRVLGLKEMGEIKQSLAAEEAADEAADSALAAAGGAPGAPAAPVNTPTAAGVAAPADGRADTISVLLQPGQGREIKLAMGDGARVDFTWSASGGVVNYDQHADRTAPPAIKYHGYKKGTAVASDTGVLVAAFDGMHGWFWRNRTTAPVTVTLRAKGDYAEWKEVK